MGHLILVDCCLTGSLVLCRHRPPALPVTCTVTMKMAQCASPTLPLGLSCLPVAERRPAIGAALRRQVLIEAGHRCAIPTCRAHPVEIEHIDDWVTVREHRFENLIALCPTCHARKGNRPGQIDRQSLKIYKANLALLNIRYGEYERRLLEQFGTSHHEDRDTWDQVRQQGSAAAMALALSSAEGTEALYDPTFTRGIPLVATLPVGQEFLMSYLIRDGHLVLLPSPDFGLRLGGNIVIIEAYALTETGMQLVEQLVNGEPLI